MDGFYYLEGSRPVRSPHSEAAPLTRNQRISWRHRPVSTSEPTDTSASDAPDAGRESSTSAESVSADSSAGDGSTNDAAENGASRDSQGSNGDHDAADVPVDELRERLASVQDELEEINEKYLRKAAEFENYRRRMDRETRRRYDAGKIDVVKAMLDVLDDLERSVDAAEELKEAQDAETAYESLRGGVDMVHRKFKDALNQIGIERIDAEGDPFDESLHEAMMQQPAPDDVEPGTVLNEVQTGYRMGDRVIRHSRVIVAT